MGFASACDPEILTIIDIFDIGRVQMLIRSLFRMPSYLARVSIQKPVHENPGELSVVVLMGVFARSNLSQHSYFVYLVFSEWQEF